MTGHPWIGRRFALVNMPDDPVPVPPGSKGTIVDVQVWSDGALQVRVEWDAAVGRSLALVVPPDEIEFE